MFRFRW